MLYVSRAWTNIRLCVVSVIEQRSKPCEYQQKPNLAGWLSVKPTERTWLVDPLHVRIYDVVYPVRCCPARRLLPHQSRDPITWLPAAAAWRQQGYDSAVRCVLTGRHHVFWHNTGYRIVCWPTTLHAYVNYRFRRTRPDFRFTVSVLQLRHDAGGYRLVGQHRRQKCTTGSWFSGDDVIERIFDGERRGRRPAAVQRLPY